MVPAVAITFINTAVFLSGLVFTKAHSAAVPYRSPASYAFGTQEYYLVRFMPSYLRSMIISYNKTCDEYFWLIIFEKFMVISSNSVKFENFRIL